MESRKNIDFRLVKFFIIGNLMKLSASEKEKKQRKEKEEFEKIK
jgi:hypothetical protein